MAGHRPWSEIEKRMTPQQRADSDALYQEKRIGLLVAEMRKQSGLTQIELADEIAAVQEGIAAYQAGDHRPYEEFAAEFMAGEGYST